MKKSKNILAVAPPAKPRLRTKPPKLSAGPVIKQSDLASPPTYKCGGKVKKTGMALVHKGEKVLTKKQQGRK